MINDDHKGHNHDNTLLVGKTVTIRWAMTHAAIHLIYSDFYG